MNHETATERRARIIADQEAREREHGVKAERLREARAQERAKMRAIANYTPCAGRQIIRRPAKKSSQ